MTEGWDGNIVWLKLTRDQADREYTKHHAPDPTEYYVKERPGVHNALLIPKLQLSDHDTDPQNKFLLLALPN